MVCFTKLTPRTPPSVIHGWKATDLLSQMVKRKNYLLNPISRQNFANALAENHNLKLEVCHMYIGIGYVLVSDIFCQQLADIFCYWIYFANNWGIYVNYGVFVRPSGAGLKIVHLLECVMCIFF